MRLLVIEDEPELATLMRDALERSGFAVDLAPESALADDQVAVTRYDAIILDNALPDGDGLSLLQRLQLREPTPPVLVLTEFDGLDDRVTGLGPGAADYLVKPFHMSELVARVRALLRRPGGALGEILSLGNLVLDTTTRQVRVDQVNIGLSVSEIMLLELLLRRQGDVLPRDALEEKLQTCDVRLGSDAIEMLVRRLQRKLADAAATPCVHIVNGIGYLLTAM